MKANMVAVKSFCGICLSKNVDGFVPVKGRMMKYLCPECNYAFYGGIDTDADGLSQCPRCDDLRRFKKKKMHKNESIRGTDKVCSKCLPFVKKGMIAVIEVEDEGNNVRTGRFRFAEIEGDLKEKLNGSVSVYVSKEIFSSIKSKEERSES